MSDLRDRLSHLSPEQRALLERRLQERGLAPTGSTASPSELSSSEAAEADPEAWRARPSARSVDLSIYLFSDDGSQEAPSKYRLAMESARVADESGFAAVWTPERHFQPFGGLYPNPSVLGAAIAATTQRIGVRAGSVALPLHNPVRVAEEWAVVDNLSNGRVGISFASGWHPDDFILYPTPYESRKEVMFEGIEIIRSLWAGEEATLTRADGTEVTIRTLPRPIQKTLPIWVTSAGNPETWRRAGEIGANVLGALVGYDADDLTAQILAYRQARADAGHDPDTGKVSLVAHTYVGQNNASVREQVREPMTQYLKTYLKQFRQALSVSQDQERDSRDVAALAYDHFFESATLLGTQNKCARVIEEVSACGVDEIACLIDFGLDSDEVLAALPGLAELCQHFANRTSNDTTTNDTTTNDPGLRSGAGAAAASPVRDAGISGQGLDS